MYIVICLIYTFIHSYIHGGFFAFFKIMATSVRDNQTQVYWVLIIQIVRQHTGWQVELCPQECGTCCPLLPKEGVVGQQPLATQTVTHGLPWATGSGPPMGMRHFCMVLGWSSKVSVWFGCTASHHTLSECASHNLDLRSHINSYHTTSHLWAREPPCVWAGIYCRHFNRGIFSLNLCKYEHMGPATMRATHS